MTDRNKVFFIAGIVVVSLAIVIGAAVLLANRSAAPGFTATTVSAVTASDHARGDASSTVSVIEYGDYECPACGAYEPLVEQLAKEYGDRVNFVFRNFPLAEIHQNAMAGAEAAEAAARAGKFWEMHDLLYAKQNEWSVASGAAVMQDLNGYAKSLGLDVAQFDADMQSPAVAAKIQADIASGNAAEVNHTPTFFINLKQIPNPNSYAAFKSAIDSALAGH
ncbi:MAG: DsbA family protein [Patescibacteria group bacterium]|nr:DsbA family protein [Patescibacteria group bacterium]MDE1944139.1 DsbA family protein [Patescibacteria group bacterium]MDE1944760.1 DsbA family protein [Patescibacteria group bacterium]MDE2058017.1 DsbA family protein [Patescibacteria group bacterium]